MKLVVLYILAMPFALLDLRRRVGGARRARTRSRPGAHGLSEVLYNFASAANNNGSAFAYQDTGTHWYTITQGLSMLDRPLLPDHPGARHRRLAGRQAEGPGDRGHLPDGHAAVRRAARRRVVIVAGLTFFPALALGPDPRTPLAVMTTTRTSHRISRARSRPRRRPPTKRPRSRTQPGVGLDLRSHDRAGRAVDALRKLDPRSMARNPVMFIVEVGSVLTTMLFLRDFGSSTARRTSSPAWSPPSSGSPCSSPTSPRRWPRAAARRRPPRCARPAPTPWPRSACPTDRSCERSSAELQIGDLCVVVAGEVIPGDGDIVEGIATVDESAITGESAPVIRESGGDRSAVTGGTRVLQRPRSSCGSPPSPARRFLDRMIALVEGADRQKTPERDRPVDPARRPDDHLHARRGDAAAVRDLLGRRADDHRARRAVGLPDPHHDRWPAVRHRHRRHGSAGAAQRAGDVGPRRRGGRRRHHVAARQDGHDHLRLAPGRRVRPGARRHRGRGRRGGAWCRRWPTRRRRVARSSSSPIASFGLLGARTIPARCWCRSPRRPACRAWTSPTAARCARAPPTRCAGSSRPRAARCRWSCCRSSSRSRTTAPRRWWSSTGGRVARGRCSA